MGMYDTVIIEYPLPMPKDPQGYKGEGACGYQTKDLENCLSTYKIRKDGTFWLKKVNAKYVEGDKNGNSVFARLGRMETISSKWVKIVHEAKSIIVYDYQECSQSSFDYFIEYEIFFVKGKVKKIKLVKFEATNNAGRKARTAEWQKQHEQRVKFCNKWYFKYVLSYWNKFICKAEKKIYRFVSFINTHLFNVGRSLKF